jgi:Tol biopolymer transport system component
MTGRAGRYNLPRSMLPAGTRLGSYEILSPIGSGGMGQVYRARDARLDRDVAIKVLPAHLTGDPEYRARFEREAKAIAALSHPNILAIHDVGVQDGTTYAVMELLEGETLRQRLIATGPHGLPLRKAVEAAIQIAHGLAAAHDKSIVHRDLKPENVFVVADGRIKILDFGLARQIAPTGAGDTSNSPTELRATDPGSVMGTVGYMSPEQVKGQTVDHRSDIFSLGCVLFEMATGHQAFHRDTAAETMTAILREDLPTLAPGHAALPANLEQVVRHCLEKRPDERFQSARDLAFALQSATTSAMSSGASAVPAAARSAARGRWVVPAIGALGITAAAFGLGRLSTGRSAAGSTPSPIASFQQISDGPGVETSPTISPDGKNVVYVSDASGNHDLYLLRVGGRNPVLLTGDSPGNDWQPAFSPNGERIAFRSDRDGGGIFLMEPTGESVRRLTNFGYNPSWSPDGREMALSSNAFTYPTDRGGTNRGLAVVDVATGKRRDIARTTDAMQPSWSPHGQRIAFWGLRSGSGQRDLWTIAADGSETDALTVTDDAALDWSPTWSPDGRYLYFSSARGGTMNLWRVPIDESSGRTLGAPEPMTTPSIYSGGLGFSRDGTKLVFASLDWRSTLFKVGLDMVRGLTTGSPMPILKSRRPIRDHELSPDGQWVAFMESGGQQEDLFVAKTDGTQYRRLTDDIARDRGPAWSPDGTRIAFYSDRSGTYHLWTIRPDGSGLEQIADVPGANFPVWSPDGRRLAFSGVTAKGFYIVESTARPGATVTPEPSIGPDETFWPFSWSADGSRLAGVTLNSSGVFRDVVIYVISDHKYTRVPNLPGSDWLLPVQLPDSRRLIVREDRGITIVDIATGANRLLVPVRGYATGRSVGVSRDSKWITFTETGTEGDIWLATIGK